MEGGQLVCTLGEARAQEIDEWGVGTQMVLGKALAIQNRPTLRLGSLDQLAHEPSLADASLARDQRQLPMSGARGLQEPQESG
jgi:hypothetical protein